MSTNVFQSETGFRVWYKVPENLDTLEYPAARAAYVIDAHVLFLYDADSKVLAIFADKFWKMVMPMAGKPNLVKP